MRIDCPHCGRQGALPEGRALPSMVRCPQCRSAFRPAVPTGAALAETDFAACPRCLEPSVADSSTCRYCGEILDPTRKTSADTEVLVSEVPPSIVLNIDVGGTATKPGSLLGGPRRTSRSAAWLQFLVVCGVSIPLGIFFAARGAQELGSLIGGLCLVIIVVSLGSFLVRSLRRMLCG